VVIGFPRLAGALTAGTGARLDIPVFASGLDLAGLLREIG